MVFEDAAVHHYEDARPARLVCGSFVDYFFLHPNGGDFELDGLVDNFFDELRPAENIDEVDFLRLRNVEQRRISFLAQALLDLRIYRDDTISVALHVGRNAVAGTHGITRQADDRDGLGALQQVGDGIGGCHVSED